MSAYSTITARKLLAQGELRGISTGGWIAIAVFCGYFFGVFTTWLFMLFWNRRTAAKAMQDGHLVTGEEMPVIKPNRTPAVGSGPLTKGLEPEPPKPAPQYFSPLAAHQPAKLPYAAESGASTSMPYSGVSKSSVAPPAITPSQLPSPSPVTAQLPPQHPGPVQPTGFVASGNSGFHHSRAASLASAHSRAPSVADAYDMTDLDDDWQTIMADVDAELEKKGHEKMDARERALAVKKLVTATGTRGVEFALEAAVQEVLTMRKFQKNRK